MTAPHPGPEGPLPVAQSRGRETLERLVEAAEEVIAERGVDGASIAAITARAGTSVGNFYRRFPDKQSLLEHLERRVLAGRADFWDRELAADRWRGRRLEQLLERVVTEIVRRHEQDRGLLRAVALRARAEYEARVAAAGVDLPGRLDDLVREVWPRAVRHPQPRLAVRLGLEMVAATAGEVLLFRSLPEPVDADTLIAELTRAWLAYLTQPPPADGAGPTAPSR